MPIASLDSVLVRREECVAHSAFAASDALLKVAPTGDRLAASARSAVNVWCGSGTSEAHNAQVPVLSRP